MSEKLCQVCNIPSSHLCAGCKAVAYCGRAHQVADWKSGHKLACKSFSTHSYTPLPPDLNKINKREHLFVVKECETGLGGFAKGSIKQGEKIFGEKPLFVVRSEFSSLDEARARIEAEYNKLDDHGKELMDSIFNAFPERGRAGILQSNAYPIDEEHGALFPYTSRINHSCAPNTNQAWNEEAKEQRLYALRDIAAGEEILVSYINTATLPYEERQNILKEHFRFECKCQLCLKCGLDPDFCEISDENRNELASIKSLLYNQGFCTPERAVDAVKRAKELIAAENLAFSELGPICFDAYVICVKSDKHQAEAKDFISTAFLAYKTSCGSEDSSTKLMKSLMLQMGAQEQRAS